MKLLGWVFSQRSKEPELDLIRTLGKKNAAHDKLLGTLFSELSKKKEFTERLSFDSGTRYFLDGPLMERGFAINKAMIRILDDLSRAEDFEESLLNRILLISSTRLHEAASQLDLLPINGDSLSNQVEDGKRASLLAIRDEKMRGVILTSLRSELQRMKHMLGAYREHLKIQNEAIASLLSGKNAARSYRSSLEGEKGQWELLEGTLRETLKHTSAEIDRFERTFPDPKGASKRGEALLRMQQDPSKALLIFHGYGNTPEESRDLRRHFLDQGFSLFAPRLPGHGTSAEEHLNTSIDEIRAYAQHCLDFFHIKNQMKPVFVLGLSLGGLLTIELSLKPENQGKIRGIIPINAPLKLKGLPEVPGKEKILKIFLALKGDFLKRVNSTIAKTKKQSIIQKIQGFSKMSKSSDQEGIKKALELFSGDLDARMEGILRRRKEAGRPIMDDEYYGKAKARIMNSFAERYKNGTLRQFGAEDLTRLLSYDFPSALSTAGSLGIFGLSEHLRKNLGLIRSPLFTIQSTRDRTTDPLSAQILNEGAINAPYKELRFFEGQHLIILDRGNEEVFEAIDEFIRKINGLSPATHSLAA